METGVSPIPPPISQSATKYDKNHSSETHLPTPVNLRPTWRPRTAIPATRATMGNSLRVLGRVAGNSTIRAQTTPRPIITLRLNRVERLRPSTPHDSPARAQISASNTQRREYNAGGKVPDINRPKLLGTTCHWAVVNAQFISRTSPQPKMPTMTTVSRLLNQSLNKFFLAQASGPRAKISGGAEERDWGGTVVMVSAP